MSGFGSWRGCLAGLVGVWVSLSALVFAVGGPMMDAAIFWSNLLTGGAIVGLAGVACRPSGRHDHDLVTIVGLGLCGVWLVVTPVVFEPLTAVSGWNTGLSGGVVVAVAGSTAYHTWRRDAAVASGADGTTR